MSKGPAKIENLDATLPEVKPDPIEARPTGNWRRPNARVYTETARVIQAARLSMWDKSKQQRRAQQYSTAAGYDYVHQRLDHALGAATDAEAVAVLSRLQASLALLTMEVGTILEDIRLTEEINKEARK